MEPPAFTDLRTYGAHLGDVSFWEPYVRTILARHRLARQGARGVSAPSIVSGFVGTFPTFLVGEVVIKLFGGFPSWRTCHDAELAAHLLLAEHPSIPAPELLAHGRLDDDPEAPWPYLVTRRLSGVAWRDADLLEDDRRRVVAALGPIVREIHELRPPAQVWPNRPLAHRASVVERHLAWGTLPRHLIEQIDEYVASLELGDARFLHADLTADHLFVADGSLIGIIDWGDAMAADRHYELVALHLDAFAADASLLRVFCETYDWPVDDELPRRVLGMALLHEFDVLAGLKQSLAPGGDLDTVRSLDELATRIFA